MGYVQALNFHRGLASLAQRLASLAETRAFGALEENNSRCVAPRIESLLAGYDRHANLNMWLGNFRILLSSRTDSFKSWMHAERMCSISQPMKQLLCATYLSTKEESRWPGNFRILDDNSSKSLCSGSLSAPFINTGVLAAKVTRLVFELVRVQKVWHGTKSLTSIVITRARFELSRA